MANRKQRRNSIRRQLRKPKTSSATAGPHDAVGGLDLTIHPQATEQALNAIYEMGHRPANDEERSTYVRSRQPILKSLMTVAALAMLVFVGGWNFSRSSIESNSAVAGPLETSRPDSEWITKSIEDIRKGDLVLARDEHGTEIGYREVAETYRRVSDHLRHLTFRDDRTGHTQTLKTTDEHPFWSVTRKEWINAGDLKTGEKFTSPTGGHQQLVKTHRTTHPEGVPVFNFQVADYHTYFVREAKTELPILVHNADYGDLTTMKARSAEIVEKNKELHQQLQKAQDRFDELQSEIDTSGTGMGGFEDYKSARLENVKTAINSIKYDLAKNGTELDQLIGKILGQ